MNYSCTIEGVELECELDYEPAERGSRESGVQLEPDHPASAYVIRVWVNGVDISNLLDSSITTRIEESFLDNMGSDT